MELKFATPRSGVVCSTNWAAKCLQGSKYFKNRMQKAVTTKYSDETELKLRICLSKTSLSEQKDKPHSEESHWQLNNWQRAHIQNIFFFKILFICSWETHRERGRDTGRGRSRLHTGSRMRDSIPGLDPGSPGSGPGLKAVLNRWATQAAPYSEYLNAYESTRKRWQKKIIR